MASTRDIITRAFRRTRIYQQDETPPAADMADALASLNDIMFSWQSDGYNIMHVDLGLSDTFYFFLPPDIQYSDNVGHLEGLLGDALNKAYDAGEWDASANSPTLTSGTGVQGATYRVSAAGSTTLDAVTSWAARDFAFYDGNRWLKGSSSRALEKGVVAILAVQLCEDYGRRPGDVLIRDAEAGMSAIRASFSVPGSAQFDNALERMPSNRYSDYWGISS